MKLWKAHGLGNDYLVWEGDANTLDAAKVQVICHRHTGIGGDGILEPTYTKDGLFGVRIWNPDGSIAEKSGNGLRIFAHWLHYTQNAPKIFFVDTGYCRVQAHILDDKISMEMGKPTFYKEIPYQKIWKTPYIENDGTFELYAMESLIHWCLFDEELIIWMRCKLLRDEHVPNRTNVQFKKLCRRHRHKNLGRGAGEASASSSSSYAVAAIAYRLGSLMR